MSKSKEDCYNEATLKNLATAEGTRMDIIYAAMDVYAKELAIGFAEWVEKEVYTSYENDIQILMLYNGINFDDKGNILKRSINDIFDLYIIQSKTNQL